MGSINEKEIEHMHATLLTYADGLLSSVSRKDVFSSNHYVLLSANLRSLLCDERPLLIEYCNNFGIDLNIWATFPSPKYHDGRRAWNLLGMMCSWDAPIEPARDNSYPRVIGSTIYNIINFLNTEFDFVDLPDGTCEWFTPKRLIKAVANKKGGTHYDPENEPRFLQELWKSYDSGGVELISKYRTENGRDEEHDEVDNHYGSIARSYLIYIAEWCLDAIRTACSFVNLHCYNTTKIAKASIPQVGVHPLCDIVIHNRLVYSPYFDRCIRVICKSFEWNDVFSILDRNDIPVNPKEQAVYINKIMEHLFGGAHPMRRPVPYDFPGQQGWPEYRKSRKEVI